MSGSADSRLIASNLAIANERISAHYRLAEHEVLPALINSFTHHDAQFQITKDQTKELAHRFLTHLQQEQKGDWLSAFLSEYQLSNAEGLALMALSEALLRIPDTTTINKLLRDKLSHGDWRAHQGQADSIVVNSATWGLSLAQSMLNDEQGILHRLVARLGEPVVRNAAIAATRLLADHFVLGENINAAIRRAYDEHLLCSFDMLGEAAKTRVDAKRYFDTYAHGIEAIGKQYTPSQRPHAISVKLSALYPRYEPLQSKHAVAALADKLYELALLAAQYNLHLTVDAEESERLQMSLKIFEQVASQPSRKEWQGLGMAVQAYQKRALPVLQWLSALATDIHKSITVRLVKGAYWDSEIKRCQIAGLNDYPVFTRKAATDVSYLACARFMLHDDHLRCAFATHNALTVAQLITWINQLKTNRGEVEFQRLHGMGKELYSQVSVMTEIACRVYAPVGSHRELLAYLIRRLLENGANNSFVHQVRRKDVPLDELLIDPVKTCQDAHYASSPAIVIPSKLFGEARRNSAGLDLSDNNTLEKLNQALKRISKKSHAASVISSVTVTSASAMPIYNPADHAHVIGHVSPANLHDINAIIDAAYLGHEEWSLCTVAERAACLQRTADLLQQQMNELVALLIIEAGKTRADATNEVREAIDFCRYYAVTGCDLMKETKLPGPTGEDNSLCLAPRGVFACISPWNFPLAIFIGQITAALIVGNSIVAKPAPQTPLIAAMAIRLLHQGGIPENVLHLLPGDGVIGEALVAHSRIVGVAFTGSTNTARNIARTLLIDSARPLVPLIAETGGINAMIVDSTALVEQVVSDVLISAFYSAGQRCSALRLLCLQEEIYEPVLDMLQGAMAELRIGNPADEDTDIGPVIDAISQQRINQYIEQHQSRVRYRAPLPSLPGHFVAPTIIEIDEPAELQQEVFGPVLHVVRWHATELRQLINSINSTGFGLTMGVHSRLNSTVALVRNHARVGNLYVNRSMIGAVVGVQPFGGEGLSGTGFKAGGPNYLLRFCTERTLSIDTTAAGGNATLLSNATS